MGQRGPAPKPTRLRILQGNPREHRLNHAEPMPEAIITPPPPPQHLPQIAKEVWIEVAEELCRARLLTTLDLKLLEVYCETYSQYRRADAFVNEHGTQFTVTNSKDQIQVVRENPAVAIRRSCMAQMRKISAHLGLSPAVRSQIPEVPSLLD